MSENVTPLPKSCTGKRQDITGISDLSWESRKDLYGNYICHTFQGGSWADRSPLHDAAFHGHLLSLRTLITQGFNVNIVTMDRVSPLHEACLGGHAACAKLLLENGANVTGSVWRFCSPMECTLTWKYHNREPLSTWPVFLRGQTAWRTCCSWVLMSTVGRPWRRLYTLQHGGPA